MFRGRGQRWGLGSGRVDARADVGPGEGRERGGLAQAEAPRSEGAAPGGAPDA